jgi:hypothetical protein
MMGTKVRTFSPLPRDLSLEDLVPQDNLYRRLEATLDLAFVRELVEPLYAHGGRPSLVCAGVLWGGWGRGTSPKRRSRKFWLLLGASVVGVRCSEFRRRSKGVQPSMRRQRTTGCGCFGP